MNSKYDEHNNKIINDSGSISFQCPACNKSEINRSKKARLMGVKYTCAKCGFCGP